MRVIAIDPDMIAPGYAEAVDGKLVQIRSIDFVELVKMDHSKDAIFIVEDIEASKPVFQRAGATGAVMRKIGQNVGQAKAAANLIVRFLEDAGVCVMLVKPLRGELKLGKKKLPAEKQRALFKKFTGWAGKSNEDSRDAGMLALYGASQAAMKAHYQKWNEQQNTNKATRRVAAGQN